MLENLFIYGTLKDKEIQKEIIGRAIEDMAEDVLGNHHLTEINIDGKKYLAITPDRNFLVAGSVVQVTDDELRRIDEYESSVYKREKVILISRKEAWAYVKA